VELKCDLSAMSRSTDAPLYDEADIARRVIDERVCERLGSRMLVA
jgi:hypothetical protein